MAYYATRYGDAMRGDGRMTPVVRWLLIANAGLFVVQSLLDRLSGGQFSRSWGVSVEGLIQGHLWQLVTYQFLHGNVIHLLLNMLCLFFLGPDVERASGTRHFLTLYLLSGVLGGAGWLAMTYPQDGYCVGASGSIFGLISAFAVLFPDRRVTLLVMFVLPVTLQAWKLGVILAGLQMLYLVSPQTGGVAYAAHLIGGLVGFLYSMTAFRAPTLQRWWHRARRKNGEPPGFSSAEPYGGVTQAEVDRILDKIATQGIQSLTPRERRQLHEASSRQRARR
jgi:membrane associated rhomboid family serine protease